MELEYRNPSGSVEISLKPSDRGANAARVIKMARAFPAAGTPDAAAVDAFLEPLRGIGAVNQDDLFLALKASPLPAGYRHFRLFAANTGMEWHGSLVIAEESKGFTLLDVVFGAFNHPTLEIEEWATTEWMPDMIPGVLDIEISFTTKPRTRPFRLRFEA